ncbi:hypothetical protein MAPG_10144 [Magnaporthiopsis poae ATCC 64411]|uniref:Uncharacterized protein n=1 Tax=Magnaporthiopsis poae (strain ATCC 64411 / 73-15) TaxID=644358 RepID=A0A0C4EBT5_MAGP6|nr:hypothetical protein MAPG_10144 [Magnaporthiopsis poae ATCC 64411]
MYFAANDLAKVVVTALLVGHAVAVPVPSQGAAIDVRDLDALEARDAAMLEARDPRRFRGGFRFGRKLFDMFGGGNNDDSNNQKRDLDEIADEAAGMLEARDPRRRGGRGGFMSGFRQGSRIWEHIRGGSGGSQNTDESQVQKRDLIDEAPEYEEAAELVARDPRRRRGGGGGFMSGFRQGSRIWEQIRGGSGGSQNTDESQVQKRDLIDEAPEYEEAAEESSDLEARDFETLEAREPGWFKMGARIGRKIWRKIRGHHGSDDNNDQQQQSS